MSATTQHVGDQLRAFLSAHGPRESSGPVILIWEMGGFPALLRKSAILAAALRLRGCRPHMIICDGTPLGCIQRGIEENDPLDNWQHRCGACSLKCAQMAETYGVPYSRVGDYLTENVRDHFRQLADTIRLQDILGFSHRDVAVGQLAWSSFNRYLKGYSFAVADLPAAYARIYRQYFYAALINTEAAGRAMQQLDPDSVLTSHGVYADYAPAMALAHLQGRAAMSWASGYADYLHYFTVPKDSNRLVVRGLSERAWLKRAAEHLSTDEEAQLDNFLHERYFQQGARDIEILSAPEDADPLKETLGIANKRPIVCLFAHVNWDACFDFSTMIFPTANDWVIESIRKMIILPEVNWIIRVHPGEITDGSVFSTGDIIKQHFPQLPDHIKILGADSEVNSFGLYRLIDAGITIFGTVGAELTAMGKPVIVAGESHYSGKGFTQDAHSPSEYLQMLEQCSALSPLTREQTKLARQYAFSFFIQRQIPLGMTQGHWGDMDPGKMFSLLPGQDTVMDLICAHILDGEDIILEGASQPALEVPKKTDVPHHDPLHQLATSVLQHLNLPTPAQKDGIVRKIVANAEPGLLAANLKAPQNRMRDFASVDDLVETIASHVQGDLEGASLRRVLAFIEEAELLNRSRKSVLDIGCGKGLFAFISRNILGHEVVTTSHLKVDPFFYEFIRTRVYGLETPLHWAIDKSASLPPEIASRSFDCIALHSFSGHGHDKPDALKWQASDWLRFLRQLHTLLNPRGMLQLRHIAFGEGILEELKKSLESEPCFNTLQCDVDNAGDKVWYQATGVQTVWGLTLQKTGPRFAIKVPQGVGSISRMPSPNRDRGTTSTQLQLQAFGRFEAGDWPGALAKFDRVLELQPGRQGLHLMRARCHAAMGQSALAAEAAEAELRIQPNHPDALQVLIRLKESDGAPLSPMTESVSVAKLEEPASLPRARDFSSPCPNPGEGLGVRGCTQTPFSRPAQEAHSVEDGVDSSLTSIPLTPMRASQDLILSPLGRGAPKIALGLNSTPALLSDSCDKNELEVPLAFAKTLAPQTQAPRFKIRVPLVTRPGSSVVAPRDFQRQAPQSSKTNGQALNRSAEIATSHRALSKLLGFDSAGEVFTDGRRILRGIFPGKATEVRKALSLYQRCDLSSRGIVKTAEVSENWSQLGYDMVLEHERVPFITYAHEWPAEMLKESALLQIDLAQELDRSGFVLKDSGASGNVLFHGPRPVFVDFLSILPKEDLERQEWLKPRGTASVFQPLWSSGSSAFHEIYRRMFFPYVLYPLHMQHQKRHEEARQRLLATTLNTCFEVISDAEAFAQATPEQQRWHTLASASRELALVRDDCQGFLRALRYEVEWLKSGVESSSYSNYYEMKREAFGFEPCSEWLPKQRGVYEALKHLKPATVLDIGANTGWFSILAARQNCQVVAMDNDEASMNLLFRRAKQEDLPILPLVMDFCKPSVDVAPFPGYEKDEHSRNSLIPGEVPLLLAMEKRLKCDLVLALAIVHHLTLGKGLSLEAVVAQLAGLAEKHLLMEFVPKEDPLIVREPEFFQAYCADPGGFSWYTEENWLKALGRYFSRIEQRDSAHGRKLLICSR